MKRNGKSFGKKLWLYFAGYAAIIFTALWLLQIVFFQKFYDSMAIRTAERAAARMQEQNGSALADTAQDGSALAETAQRLAAEYSLLIFITDQQGNVLHGADEHSAVYEEYCGWDPEETDSGEAEEEQDAEKSRNSREEQDVGESRNSGEEQDTGESQEAGESGDADGRGNPYRADGEIMNWQIGAYRNLPQDYTEFLSMLAESADGTIGYTTENREAYVYGTYLYDSGKTEEELVLYISIPLGGAGAAVGILRTQLIWVTGISLVMGFVLAYFLARQFARPVAALSRQAADMARPSAGMTKQAAGMTKQAAGMTKQAAGMTKQAAGMAEPVAGRTEQTAGMAQQAAGMAQPMAGMTKQTAGKGRSEADIAGTASGAQGVPGNCVRTGGADGYEKGFCRELDELSDTLMQTEAALRRLENSRRELLANISHDLRTPLTMIKGYAEMIRDISGDDAQARKEDLAIIITEADRLTGLVNEILQYSAMQSADLTVKKQRMNLSAATQMVAEQFVPLCEKKHCRIETQIAPGQWVMGDESLLKRVLYNFIDNAVSHSAGSAKIEISVKSVGNMVRVEVRDHGPGIPREELPGIWDRYFTAKQRGRAGQSSGLGLAIAKEILQKHGAGFGAESVEGQGCMFWFALEREEV